MDDEQRWRYTRRGALGLMGVGLLGLASGVFGFETQLTDRDISIGVENDLDAIVNVSANPGTGPEPIQDGNFNSSIDITYTNQYGPALNLSTTITNNENTNVTVDESGFGDGTKTLNNTDDTATFTDGTLDSSDTLTITVDDNGASTNLTIETAAEFNGNTVQFTRNNVTVTDTT